MFSESIYPFRSKPSRPIRAFFLSSQQHDKQEFSLVKRACSLHTDHIAKKRETFSFF
jgi:hypothetical protein